MLKVILNAYACSPNKGSEPGMAWNWCAQLAKQCELFIITEGEFRDDIEKEVKKLAQGSNMHFYYNPVSEEVRQMCWNQGDWRFYYFYKKWQKKTLKIAESILAEHHIDIIHHLSMIGFREPGYLWKIKDIPYVWGPIGGMSYVPMQYMENEDISTKLKYYCKNLVSRFQFRYSHRVKNAFRRSNVLIASNKDSFRLIQSKYPKKSIVLINETGCSDIDGQNLMKKDDASFNILWVGRFIPTKLFEMSLKVMKELIDLPNIKLHIIGSSNDETRMKRYRNLSKSMGVDHLCKWYGWISHDEVQNMMRESSILFFPSVVEGTPHVVLEAIANSLPVVCFDVCGQGDVVNEKVGVKIQLSEPNDSIHQFADAIRSLYNDRAKLELLSRNCHERRKELSWENKSEQMTNIYENLLS